MTDDDFESRTLRRQRPTGMRRIIIRRRRVTILADRGPLGPFDEYGTGDAASSFSDEYGTGGASAAWADEYGTLGANA